MLSDRAIAEIEKARRKYPDPRSALLPALAVAQRENDGWLSPEVMAEVVGVMGLSPAEVGSVASFYTLFNRRPVGRHLIQVCTNISCSLLGAEHIAEYLKSKLNVEVGQTTADGQFTLLEVECLGSCGTAPMMQVDDEYYESLTEERVDKILTELQ